MAVQNENSGGTRGSSASRAEKNQADSAAQAEKMRNRNREINRGVRGETDEFEPWIHHGEMAGKQEHVKGGYSLGVPSGRPARDTPNPDLIQRGRPIRDTPNHTNPSLDNLIGLGFSGRPEQDTPNPDFVQRGRPIVDTPNHTNPDISNLIGLWQSGRPEQDTPNPDYQLLALLKMLREQFANAL